MVPMLNVQRTLEALSAMDDQTATQVICQVLQTRPELAPSVVNAAVPDLTYVPVKALTDRRSKGIVKGTSQVGGYDFITCPEIHAVFGNDVFVHGKQRGLFQKGQEVSFAVLLNKDNKPQAFDVQEAHSSGGMGMNPMHQMMQQPAGKAWTGQGENWSGGGAGSGGGGGDGHWNQNWDQGAGWSGGNWDSKGGNKGSAGKGKKRLLPADDPGQVLGQFIGVIKKYDMNNGFGFVECPEVKSQGFTNDCFLHHTQLGPFQVGSQVQFTCFVNAKGQPQCRDLQEAPKTS